MLRSSCLPSLAAAPLALLRSSYATTATTVHPLVATLRGALKQSMLARTTERTSVIKVRRPFRASEATSRLD